MMNTQGDCIISYAHCTRNTVRIITRKKNKNKDILPMTNDEWGISHDLDTVCIDSVEMSTQPVIMRANCKRE